jgi:hypothetical protein
VRPNQGLLLSGAPVAGCPLVAGLDWQKRQALHRLRVSARPQQKPRPLGSQADQERQFRVVRQTGISLRLTVRQRLAGGRHRRRATRPVTLSSSPSTGSGAGPGLSLVPNRRLEPTGCAVAGVPYVAGPVWKQRSGAARL